MQDAIPAAQHPWLALRRSTRHLITHASFPCWAVTGSRFQCHAGSGLNDTHLTAVCAVSPAAQWPKVASYVASFQTLMKHIGCFECLTSTWACWPAVLSWSVQLYFRWKCCGAAMCSSFWACQGKSVCAIRSLPKRCSQTLITSSQAVQWWFIWITTCMRIMAAPVYTRFVTCHVLENLLAQNHVKCVRRIYNAYIAHAMNNPCPCPHHAGPHALEHSSKNWIRE